MKFIRKHSLLVAALPTLLGAWPTFGGLLPRSPQSDVGAAVSPVIDTAVAAAPVATLPPDPNPSKDVRLLNLALIFEHIIQSFYTDSLGRFDSAQFAADGHPDWVRDRYEEMKGHSDVHVAYLNSAIAAAGGVGIQPCTYKFPKIVNNTRDFIDVSAALATITSSAYAGALKEFENKDYSQAFASLLGTEARHAAWVTAAVQNQSPWNTGFETALSLNMAFNIIGNFIIRGTCPKSNNIITTLPSGLSDNPGLTIPIFMTPGAPMEITFDSSALIPGNSMYAAFVTGTGGFFEPVTVSDSGVKSVMVPNLIGNQGAVFIVIVQDENVYEDGGILSGMGTLDLPASSFTVSDKVIPMITVVDKNILTSPALAMFAYDSQGRGLGAGKSEDLWAY